MANQLSHLLSQWYPHRDDSEWVLGTVYKTQGPCYRKAGAMMLFSGLGQQFGMLSGGCLESDLQQHARRVMHSGQAITLCYDGSDEDDLAFQLGIGCGGTVFILLQPVSADNHYLMLDEVYLALKQRSSGYYYQRIADKDPDVEGRFIAASIATSIADPIESQGGNTRRSQLVEEGGMSWLKTPIVPDPHLLVVGGGIDARPLVAMAHQLGWQVTLWDPRPANARREFFTHAGHILRCPGEVLGDYAMANSVDAVVLMAHNVALDALALKALQKAHLSYLAMLGPKSRRIEVERAAGVDARSLPFAIAGPAGLDIGGELPESIALSILAECHASLKQRSGQSLSNILSRAVSGVVSA